MTVVVLLVLVPCLKKYLPASGYLDTVVLLAALVFGTVCGLWTGWAVDAGSSWQIFGAFIVGGVGPAASSPLKAMLSKCVAESHQGRMLAIQSGMESLAKVLGPSTYSAIYVATVTRHPALVFYVMAAEAVLLVPVAVCSCTMYKPLFKPESNTD